MSDQSVECERDHDGDGDALGSCFGVEHFGWDDPGKTAAGERERDLVAPVDHDECPPKCVLS